MPRSLVPGRGHGKQLHRCSLCNCTGHRQETCPSAAGELIRSLREQLREKGRTAKKKQQARRNFVFHKKGTWRKEAAQRYSGRDTTSQRLKVSRDTLLEDREACSSEDSAWRRLLQLGYCQKADKCCHCSGTRLRVSKSSTRSASQVYLTCADCGKYTNVLHSSPFRDCRCSPSQLLEILSAYVRGSYTERPTADRLHRSTGLGRSMISSIVDVCLRSEFLLGQERNYRVLRSRLVEADAHGLRAVWVSTQNKHCKLALERSGHGFGPMLVVY